MNQPVPTVSRSDVERIVRREFGEFGASEVLAILDGYQSDGGNPARVQLAALKLAAGDMVALRRAIEAAKLDYRDVLAGAEYPKYSRDIGFGNASESFKQALIEDDWKQYESWFKR